MATIAPTGCILGARVTGIDLSRPLADADFAAILAALGRHGVLCFPDQRLDAAALRDFSKRFGGIQTSVTGKFHHPSVPEVGYLSNIVENGEPIGLADAGQDWHTDMTYNKSVGFTDYRPDEPRLMMRCQVMADRFFDPQFVRAALKATTAA